MEEAIVLTYGISADDFTRAGGASSNMKRKLKQMGVSPNVIQKVAIVMYEGGINMIVHAKGDVITVETATEKVKMMLTDMSPGIPDVRLATQAGYSTTPDKTHSLGFGASMGLPNMKKYSDSMSIDTRIGEGTTIIMMVNL